MSEDFNKITEKILKAISEQNKRFENLEDKIEKITIEKIKEFLSNEDILIDDTPSESKSETLLLKGIENRLKTLEESSENSLSKNEINEKLLAVEEENKELKKQLMKLEEKLNLFDDFDKKLLKIEEKLKKYDENNKINFADTDTKRNKSDKEDLEIKKDGKVVNIVINV